MRKNIDNKELSHEGQAEYRRRAAIKAKRRKKRRQQKILLLSGFAVLAILFIVGIVALVRFIAGSFSAPKKKLPASSAVSSSVADVLPALANPVAQDPTRWELVLVNKNIPAPEGFKPETKGISSAGYHFDARAVDPLLDMIAACNKATEGNSLAVASALRGAQTQNDKNKALVDLFKGQGDDEETAKIKAGEIEPAYPMSDHQTALGVDFVTSKITETSQEFGGTPEFAWLREHAAEYGFVLRFPENKADITGITYQPYHFRYVGKEDAVIINNAGICLEEYVTAKPEQAPASGGGSSVLAPSAAA